MKYYPCINFDLCLYHAYGRRSILKIVSLCTAVLLLLKIVVMSGYNHHMSSREHHFWHRSAVSTVCVWYSFTFILYVPWHCFVLLDCRSHEVWSSVHVCTRAKKQQKKSPLYNICGNPAREHCGNTWYPPSLTVCIKHYCFMHHNNLFN